MRSDASSLSRPRTVSWGAILLIVLFLLQAGALIWDFSVLEHLRDYLRLDLPTARSEAPRIADVVTVRQRVSIQEGGSLTWKEIPSGAAVLKKESLLTDADSQAEIAFLDGTGLVIGPDSLVVVDKTPDDLSNRYARVKVRLVRGQVFRAKGQKAKPGPPIDLELGETGDSIITLSPNVEFSASPSRVTVTSGEVIIKTSAGTSVSKTGEEVALPKAGEKMAPPKKRALVPLLPLPGHELRPDKKVTLTWMADPAQLTDGPQVAEISRSPAFTEILHAQTIPATHPPMTHLQARLDLSSVTTPGNLYWRIRSSSSRHFSETRTLILPVGGALRLISPLEDARYQTGSEVTLVWTGTFGSYEVELDGRRLSVQGNNLVLRGLLEGTHTWRVRAGSEGMPWSQERHFGVSKELPKPPPPPSELLEPEFTKPGSEKPHGWSPLRNRNWVENLWNLFVSTAHADESLAYHVKLRWSAVPGASKYKVQVSRLSSFQNLISEAIVDSPEWTWDFVPGQENSKGRVFYRVASIGETGEEGGFSAPKPVPIPPELRAEIDAADERTSTDEPHAPLKWNLGIGTGFGGLSQTSAQSDLKSVVLEAPSAQIKLHGGVSWRNWLFQLDFRNQATKSAIEVQDTDPNATRYLESRLSVQRTVHVNSALTRTFAAGLSALRSHRWTKSTRVSVTPTAAFSFGPSASLHFNGPEARGFKPALAAAEAMVPLSGFFMTSEAGIRASVWSEWLVHRGKKISWRARLESELRWGSWKIRSRHDRVDGTCGCLPSLARSNKLQKNVFAS